MIQNIKYVLTCNYMKFISFDIILWNIKHWSLALYIPDVLHFLLKVFSIHFKFPLKEKFTTLQIGIPQWHPYFLGEICLAHIFLRGNVHHMHSFLKTRVLLKVLWKIEGINTIPTYSPILISDGNFAAKTFPEYLIPLIVVIFDHVQYG